MRDLAFQSGNIEVYIQAGDLDNFEFEDSDGVDACDVSLPSAFRVETVSLLALDTVRASPTVVSNSFYFDRELEDYFVSLNDVEGSALLTEDAIHGIMDADAEEVLEAFGVLECDMTLKMWLVGIKNASSKQIKTLTVKHYSADDGYINYFKFQVFEDDGLEGPEEDLEDEVPSGVAYRESEDQAMADQSEEQGDEVLDASDKEDSETINIQPDKIIRNKANPVVSIFPPKQFPNATVIPLDHRTEADPEGIKDWEKVIEDLWSTALSAFIDRAYDDAEFHANAALEVENLCHTAALENNSFAEDALALTDKVLEIKNLVQNGLNIVMANALENKERAEAFQRKLLAYEFKRAFL